MPNATYTCPWHGEVPAGESCPACVEWYATRPDPADMTADERVAEMRRFYDNPILTVDFSTLHARIEALCGCPVWTHQLIETDYLIELARKRSGEGQAHIAMAQLSQRVPPERIIEVTTDA